MSGQAGNDGRQAARAERAARRAAALRENLRRRKAQARGRGAQETAGQDGDLAGAPDGGPPGEAAGGPET